MKRLRIAGTYGIMKNVENHGRKSVRRYVRGRICGRPKAAGDT